MYVKAKTVESRAFGMHPTEIVAEVATVDGSAFVILDQQSIENGGIDIGFPVGADKGKFLVELPRETLQGTWRIWVESTQLFSGQFEKKIA